MDAWSQKIDSVQQNLKHVNLDGWLIYDFRRSNRPGCAFLEIPEETLLTRRFFYFIPTDGTPVKIVHRIESKALDRLPGKAVMYGSWKELDDCLSQVLKGAKRVAMEYSPNNAIPTISTVDAGTIEAVRRLGVAVESSADLLQVYTCVWTEEQYVMHRQAADVLQKAVEKAWRLISDAIKEGRTLSEYDVQQFLLNEFHQAGCTTDHPPICAVNGHAADPHYAPEVDRSAQIKRGDFVLIDVWCKKNVPKAVYADITRVAVTADVPTEKQQVIFEVVKKGRDAAFNLLRDRLEGGRTVRGYEVDQVCRDAIEEAGYGRYFVHRTGHSIGEKDHGDGANIDNYETQDFRLLLPGTCFSIEPGVYLPGEFGVRLEDDVYLAPDGQMHLTPGTQHQLMTLL